MNQQVENRREFFKRAGGLAVAFPLLFGCRSETSAQKTIESALGLIRKNARPAGTEGMGAVEAPDNVSWRAALPKKSEKDELITISGKVYEADGETPAPNVLIYFYHTDAEGIYGRSGEPQHGHFRGWLLTDARGRYEFSSIKPASYPNLTFAAHVHMTVTTANAREDWIDSILFEGDKFITEAERKQAGKRGGFNPILKLEKDADGRLRGVRNIQLMR